MRSDLTGVFDALAPLRDRGGANIMLIAARRGEGVSCIARAIAQTSARTARKPVLLVDLDVARDQHRTFYEDLDALRLYPDGRLKGASFFRIVNRGAEDAEAMARLQLARVGDSQLYVTTFDAKRMPKGAAIRLEEKDQYWRLAKAGAELTIVDAPALERSRAALPLIPFMDGVVMIVSGEKGSSAQSIALKREIDARGGNLLGIVYTDADPVAIEIERRLSFVRASAAP